MSIVMHIDVNSAFLSWTAAYEKQIGLNRDIRNVTAVIGGNEENRHFWPKWQGTLKSRICAIPASLKK